MDDRPGKFSADHGPVIGEIDEREDTPAGAPPNDSFPLLTAGLPAWLCAYFAAFAAFNAPLKSHFGLLS